MKCQLPLFTLNDAKFKHPTIIRYKYFLIAIK